MSPEELARVSEADPEALDQLACELMEPEVGEWLFLPPIPHSEYMEIVQAWMWDYLIGCIGLW